MSLRKLAEAKNGVKLKLSFEDQSYRQAVLRYHLKYWPHFVVAVFKQPEKSIALEENNSRQNFQPPIQTNEKLDSKSETKTVLQLEFLHKEASFQFHGPFKKMGC